MFITRYKQECKSMYSYRRRVLPPHIELNLLILNVVFSVSGQQCKHYNHFTLCINMLGTCVGNSEPLHMYILRTLNISVFHHISLTVKTTPTECPSNPAPSRDWMVSGIEVKVRFSPLGGTMEVSLYFVSLNLW